MSTAVVIDSEKERLPDQYYPLAFPHSQQCTSDKDERPSTSESCPMGNTLCNILRWTSNQGGRPILPLCGENWFARIDWLVRGGNFDTAQDM